MKNARRETRIPHDSILHYSLYGDSSEKIYRCSALDISNSGLGIITDAPLEFGQFVEFEPVGSGFSSTSGVVQWSMSAGDKYRAGLFLF